MLCDVGTHPIYYFRGDLCLKFLLVRYWYLEPTWVHEDARNSPQYNFVKGESLFANILLNEIILREFFLSSSPIYEIILYSNGL